MASFTEGKSGCRSTKSVGTGSIEVFTGAADRVSHMAVRGSQLLLHDVNKSI